MTTEELEKVPYGYLDFTIVADSICESGDRLTTILIAAPPHLTDTILQLPNCQVSACYRGWDAEMIAQTTNDIEPPVHMVPAETDFGTRMIASTYADIHHRIRKSLQCIVDHVDTSKVDVRALNTLSHACSTQVFVITASDWFEARFMMEMSGDATLLTLSSLIEDGLRESEPAQMGEGDWHLPFITSEIMDAVIPYVQLHHGDEDADEQLMRAVNYVQKVSIARVARGGPIDNYGNEVPFDMELARSDKIEADSITFMHATGHLAQPDPLRKDANGKTVGFLYPQFHRPYAGWCTLRRMMYYAAIDQAKQKKDAQKKEGPKLSVINGGLDG